MSLSVSVKTHVTSARDAVVITVSPAAAVGHTSVLALYHTVCMRRETTVLDISWQQQHPANVIKHKEDNEEKRWR